jgi:hypothetical protein
MVPHNYYERQQTIIKQNSIWCTNRVAVAAVDTRCLGGSVRRTRDELLLSSCNALSVAVVGTRCLGGRTGGTRDELSPSSFLALLLLAGNDDIKSASAKFLGKLRKFCIENSVLHNGHGALRVFV